tara:strand:- start:923 stop:1111 length:189 start_codon:yes stop_codon:yes gene_type:complete
MMAEDLHYYTNERIEEEILILYQYIKRLRKRNDWLEEVVALLQEEGVDLSMEGYPLWEDEEE